MEKWGDSACCSANFGLKVEVGRAYLGIGDLQGTRGDGLGEHLALRRHHGHGLVQGSTWGEKKKKPHVGVPKPPNFQVATTSPAVPTWHGG